MLCQQKISARGSMKKASKITGEELADTLLTRNSGCVNCQIRCERRVMVYGKEVKGPEYETVGPVWFKHRKRRP